MWQLWNTQYASTAMWAKNLVHADVLVMHYMYLSIFTYYIYNLIFQIFEGSSLLHNIKWEFMPCILTPVFLSKWKAKVASVCFTAASSKMLFPINGRCQINKDEHLNQNVPQLTKKKSLEAWCTGRPPQLTLLSLLAEGNLKRKQELLHLVRRSLPSLPLRRLHTTNVRSSSLNRAESSHVRYLHN